MSDWTGQRPLPETWADSEPPPTPWTPGWSRWIEYEADHLKGVAGRTDNPDTVTLQVQRGTEKFWYASEGDNPQDWQRDPVTAEVQEPEYRDFTRFSRFYPRIVLAAYVEVRVRLVFRFSNPEETWEKNFLMYERTGETREEKDYRVYRWVWTSWINEVNGQKVKIHDETPPSNEDRAPRVGREQLGSPSDEPPPDMMRPKPRPAGGGGELYYAAASDFWLPARRHALLESGEPAAFAGVKKKAKDAPKKPLR